MEANSFRPRLFKNILYESLFLIIIWLWLEARVGNDFSADVEGATPLSASFQCWCEKSDVSLNFSPLEKT